MDPNKITWNVPFYTGTRRYIPGKGEMMRVTINLPDGQDVRR